MLALKQVKNASRRECNRLRYRENKARQGKESGGMDWGLWKYLISGYKNIS